MSPVTSPSATLTGRPFTALDRALIATWGNAVAFLSDVIARVTTDHEDFPEMLEITPPQSLPLNVPLWVPEVRWMVWRNAAGGIVVDDILDHPDVEPQAIFPTLSDALEHLTLICAEPMSPLTAAGRGEVAEVPR